LREDIEEMERAAKVLDSIASKLKGKMTAVEEEPEKPRQSNSSDQDDRKRKLSVESNSSQEPSRKKKSVIARIFGPKRPVTSAQR